MVDYDRLWVEVENHRQRLVAFAQKLVQTPSMPGQEGDVASLVLAEMETLNYDRVWADNVGNVIGQIDGSGSQSLMLNGHMDHVAPGDPASWPYPPFGGAIHDGYLWGRGAADMKGAVAAMVYAGAIAKKLNVAVGGPLYVCGVVQEEVGGLGTRHLARTLPVQRAIIGEASGNQLRRGHRGRVELQVRFDGRPVHASMPDLGVNPHFSLARFVGGLQKMGMVSSAEYGASTVAPTGIAGQPPSANVTPSSLQLTLDWRNIPGEGPNEILTKVQSLLSRSLESECRGDVRIVEKDLISYKGVPVSYPDTFPSFSMDADHPWLIESQSLLSAVLGRQIDIGIWQFATDGGHLAAAGSNVLGFGPGDETIVHTVEERLPLDQLVESVVGYVSLSQMPAST